MIAFAVKQFSSNSGGTNVRDVKAQMTASLKGTVHEELFDSHTKLDTACECSASIGR